MCAAGEGPGENRDVGIDAVRRERDPDAVRSCSSEDLVAAGIEEQPHIGGNHTTGHTALHIDQAAYGSSLREDHFELRGGGEINCRQRGQQIKLCPADIGSYGTPLAACSDEYTLRMVFNPGSPT